MRFTVFHCLDSGLLFLIDTSSSNWFITFCICPLAKPAVVVPWLKYAVVLSTRT